MKDGTLQAQRLIDIPSLTGLRFIAAFSIALGHSLPHTEVWGIDFHGITVIGMPIFFTLSGFIIHYIYADQFANRQSGAIPNFAVSRFSRIYPLYWFLLVVAMLTTPMGSRLLSVDGLPMFAVYILGVTTWAPFMMDGSLLGQWYYGVSWSISTEMFFYVCYALALWRFVRMDRRTCAVTLVVFMIAAFVFLWFVFSTRDEWEPCCCLWSRDWFRATKTSTIRDIVGFYTCRRISKSSRLSRAYSPANCIGLDAGTIILLGPW